LKIKWKGKTVNVAEKDCFKYECFSPHKFIHQSKSIDGIKKSWQDEYYSCSYRNYNGCPKIPKLKAEFE